VTLLDSLDDADIVAAGMIGDPDPYTATMNAVQYFHLGDRHLDAARGPVEWVADKLVDRVRAATNLPVEHIESHPRRGGLAWPRTHAVEHEHHEAAARGEPSSRAAAMLGMLLSSSRGDDLRGLLHGLLLHPRGQSRSVAGAGLRVPKRSPPSTRASWSRPRSRSTTPRSR
jgi:hypothetical protein